MKTKTEFQEIDIREADESRLRALHELSVEIEKEEMPGDPPRPFDEFVSEYRTMPSYIRLRFWLAWDDGGKRLLGASSFRAKYKEENRHIGRLGVRVLPDHRRKGLGRGLLLPAATAAKEDGRTLMGGYCFEGGPGVGFADRVGSKATILEYWNRLTLADLNRAMLDQWVERASERASEYSLIFWEGPCPEEWRQKFADLSMVMNTAPRPESEEDEKVTPEMVAEWDDLAESQGWVPWTYVAQHDPTGEWGGYTRMWPSIFRKEFAYQDDTGVIPAHRNRGLGRWLKAAMLVKLFAERPETRWVDTGNATTNEPMLGINRALGFKPVLVWQYREIETGMLLERLS